MTPALLTKSQRLLAYAQLVRLPNVFTAMADIFMGYWFTRETLSPVGVFLLLVLTSSLLYSGGMVLNDVCDLEQDRRERPNRPIPSGRVPLHVAAVLPWALLILGMTAGCIAALLAGDVRPLACAVLLDVAVFFYNGALKKTVAGPLVMGCCRMLNVLLGMSASPDPWAAPNYVAAIGIGVYVVGVTWFARNEAATSRRIHLVAGSLCLFVGMAMLWRVPTALSQEASADIHPQGWLLLWIGLSVLIGWRFVRAIIRPDATCVQTAVKSGILSIIALDAAVVLAVRGPLAAIATLALLVPAIILGHWVYST